MLLSDHARLVLQSADVDPRTNEDALRYKKRRFNAIRRAAGPVRFDELQLTDVAVYLLSERKPDGTYLTHDSYAGKRSALFHMYRFYGLQQSAAFSNQFTLFMKGLKRLIALQRGEGVGSILSGKRPMSFELYKRMAEWWAHDDTTEGAFCHLFLVLTWNLMCRVANTKNIHTNHIRWLADALVIVFAHQKNDQGGERSFPRHLYANPLNPYVCPSTVLGKYLAVFPQILQGGGFLFPGHAQEERFAKAFDQLLKVSFFKI